MRHTLFSLGQMNVLNFTVHKTYINSLSYLNNVIRLWVDSYHKFFVTDTVSRDTDTRKGPVDYSRDQIADL